MNEILQITLLSAFLLLFIVGIPTLIYYLIKNINSKNHIELDRSFSLRELYFKLISYPWSFREITVFLLILIPLFVYQELFSILSYNIIIIASLIFISWYVLVKSSKKEESTKELVENLSSMLSRVNESTVYIEALATTIEKREKEAIKKKELLEELQYQVQNNQEQAKELETLSDKQKELLLESAKDALKPTSFNMIVTIIIGLFVNIIAMIIWTLADTPGKEQILDLFTILK